MSETVNRSLIKTLSWRVTGSVSTFLISYLISNDFTVAGSIAIIQVIVNTLLYYIHERSWNLVNWGKE